MSSSLYRLASNVLETSPRLHPRLPSRFEPSGLEASAMSSRLDRAAESLLEAASDAPSSELASAASQFTPPAYAESTGARGIEAPASYRPRGEARFVLRPSLGQDPGKQSVSALRLAPELLAPVPMPEVVEPANWSAEQRERLDDLKTGTPSVREVRAERTESASSVAPRDSALDARSANRTFRWQESRDEIRSQRHSRELSPAEATGPTSKAVDSSSLVIRPFGADGESTSRGPRRSQFRIDLAEPAKAAERAAAPPAFEQAIIHVTIGRVEVRATQAAGASRQKSPARPQLVSLDEYLSARARRTAT